MEIRLIPIAGAFLLIAACLSLAACAVVNQPRFGKAPEGERLDRIKASPNYRDGQFVNQIPTPKFSDDASFVSVVLGGFFDKPERLVPEGPVPVLKTDLKALAELHPQKDAVVWLGHSSWFIQMAGRRILIDPVLSPSAAPFSFLNKAFPGTSIYGAEDFPEIDCLIISHDHWDHLDYPTVMALKSKVGQVICPLGVGAYFEQWGYAKERIREGDWYDKIALSDDFIVHVLPARHYSGRMLKANQTLWAAFALEGPGRKIFYSGDSGYGPHFQEIGAAFDGFDLVLLDCGQYDPRWPYIHMNPEEAGKAARDLMAEVFIPSHIGRFTIARHAWDDPFYRLAQASRSNGSSREAAYTLVMPEIGESISLGSESPRNPGWWKSENPTNLTKK